MTPPKPRRYNGPVDWLAIAREHAEDWTSDTMERVVGLFPYDPPRGVRMEDWCLLVAHTSTTRDEDPLATAQRLALYVKAYAERYPDTDPPDPHTLKETTT